MSHNTWIHRLVRGGVRPLVNTPVTPNQITTLRVGVGVAAAVALAEGSDLWRHWGAGIFLASMVLDRADGELARASGKTSPWGHKYDLFSDALCNALAFICLGIGLRDSIFGVWAYPMGMAAGAAISAILLLVLKLEEQAGQRAAELSLARGFDPDDGMLAVPLLIWLGLSEGLLAAAAIGAPGFAIYMFIKFRRGPRSGQSSSGQSNSGSAGSGPAAGG